MRALVVLLAAAPALAAGPVTHIPADQVKAAFEKGAVLVDGSGGRNYMVHASRRDAAGQGEVHVSPDERFLYVDNWDLKRKVVMRYPVRGDGTLGTGEVFFDLTGAPGDEALDGLKVDQRGNLYVSGPGGVWIVSPAGKHLGTIRAPELPANFAWGDDDGRTLYLAARTSLYRVRLDVAGIPP